MLCGVVGKFLMIIVRSVRKCARLMEWILILIFFLSYAFYDTIHGIFTSTLVLGINYFVVITRPLHQIQARKRMLLVQE